MNKRANKELFLAKIVIAIALVAIFVAGLWMFIGQDTIAVQSAKEAYSLYMIENPEATDKDFIYIYEDTVIVAIRNGKVVRKEYATEADAVKAALGSKDGANYSLAGTGNGKLFVVKLFEKTDDIYALGTSTLATGAEKLTIKVVSNGMIFATFEIPAEAIDRKQSPVGVTIKKINPEDNVKLGKNETGFAYDIDVTNLVKGNTARIAITMNGPRGLLSDNRNGAITAYHKDKNIVSTYDATTGKISFSTTSFSPFTFTWEEFEVKNLAELRYYLQLSARVNIKLANSISINLADGDRQGADDTNKTFSYTNTEIGVTNETTYYSKGQYAQDSIDWLYFGALVFGEKSLDLNGYTIEYNGNPTENDSALFAVGDNSSFTIRDTYTGEDRQGTIKMLFDHYAVWAVNDSSTVNIYGGIFAADKYTGATPEPNRSLIYSSGGEIHVRGGYFLFENTDKDDQTNGGFNVLNEIDVPRIWIYGGVYMREELYRQDADGESQKETIMLIGGADVSPVSGTLSVLGFESLDNGENDEDKWFTITGQTMQVIPDLNTDKYIYRVGNGNSFKLSAFFEMIGDLPEGGNISVRAVDIIKTRKAIDDLKQSQGYGAGGYYGNITATTQIDTKNIGSLDAAVQFTGFTGPVRLELYDSVSGALYASINLEVVDAVNATSATSVASNNVCLLNGFDATSKYTIENGYTLYGNGFVINDMRTDTSGYEGVYTIKNGTMDNVIILGYKSTDADAAMTANGRAAAVYISGPGNIYNSYIAGGRQAILCSASGKVHLKNVTLDGGIRANMEITSGDVVLENCVTKTDTRYNQKGLGILVSNAGAKLTLEGTFTQHNWLKNTELPTEYQSVLGSFYTSPYQYNSCVNMGIFFLSSGVTFDYDQVSKQLTDNTTNIPAAPMDKKGPYNYVENTYMGHIGTVYLPLGDSLGAETFAVPAYKDYKSLGNHPIVPKSEFDHTDPNKNYQAKTDGSNVYCYEDNGCVYISFDQGEGSKKVWKTDILTATKNGKTLEYAVYRKALDSDTEYIEIDGEKYVKVGETYDFDKAGEYSLYYVCTDPYNYTKDFISYTLQYVKELKFNVTVVEPDAIVHKPTFSYPNLSGLGAEGTDDDIKFVTINNKTYVMPNVTSSTTGSYGSKQINGVTVYYPIVKVYGYNSSGTKVSSYEGTGMFDYVDIYSPAFTDINIVDYYQDKAEATKQYEYNVKSTKWPHNLSTLEKNKDDCNSQYFGWSSPDPFAGNTGDNAEFLKTKSGLGLCFKNEQIGKRAVEAYNKTTEFYYVGNDNVKYYYLINYQMDAISWSEGSSSCVTPDTLITLADGSQVRVDSLTGKEQLLVWNLKTGKYEAAPIVFVDSELEKAYEIIHLYFSDGSDVKVISEHGFFDLDLGKYVYIDAENYADYVGHRFVTEGDISKDTWNVVTLDKVNIETEVTTAWSPVTFEHLCYYTNGVLSMPGGIEGLFNIFEVDTDTMTYDAEKMAQDIAIYGLLTLDDFGGMIPQAAFDAFNGQYLNVAIGKGLLTWEQIEALAERYVPLM